MGVGQREHNTNITDTCFCVETLFKNSEQKLKDEPEVFRLDCFQWMTEKIKVGQLYLK